MNLLTRFFSHFGNVRAQPVAAMSLLRRAFGAAVRSFERVGARLQLTAGSHSGLSMGALRQARCLHFPTGLSFSCSCLVCHAGLTLCFSFFSLFSLLLTYPLFLILFVASLYSSLFDFLFVGSFFSFASIFAPIRSRDFIGFTIFSTTRALLPFLR